MSAGIPEWLMSKSPSSHFFLSPSSSPSLHSLHLFLFLLISITPWAIRNCLQATWWATESPAVPPLNLALFHHGNSDFRFTCLRHGRTLTLASLLSCWISAQWPHINVPPGLRRPWLSHQVYCYGDKQWNPIDSLSSGTVGRGLQQWRWGSNEGLINSPQENQLKKPQRTKCYKHGFKFNFYIENYKKKVSVLLHCFWFDLLSCTFPGLQFYTF